VPKFCTSAKNITSCCGLCCLIFCNVTQKRGIHEVDAEIMS
jgi:hypothetical protein